MEKNQIHWKKTVTSPAFLATSCTRLKQTSKSSFVMSVFIFRHSKIAGCQQWSIGFHQYCAFLVQMTWHFAVIVYNYIITNKINTSYLFYVSPLLFSQAPYVTLIAEFAVVIPERTGTYVWTGTAAFSTSIYLVTFNLHLHTNNVRNTLGIRNIQKVRNNKVMLSFPMIIRKLQHQEIKTTVICYVSGDLLLGYFGN